MSIKTRGSRLRITAFFLGFLFLASPAFAAKNSGPIPHYEGDIYVQFATGDLIEERLTAAIAAEILFNKEDCRGIYVAAYSFTSKTLAKQLIAAHNDGVLVQVLLDKGQLSAKRSQARAFEEAGIPVRYDTKHDLFHIKMMLFNMQYAVFTGSYNFTDNAKRNVENVVAFFEWDREKVKKGISVIYPFYLNFTRHWEHALPRNQIPAT